MSNYTIVGEAKGVKVQELWRWYTDFRSDDSEILDREGVDMRGAKTLYRNVTKEGDQVHIDQAVQWRKRRIEMSLDITLHPENLTYDVVGGVKGLLHETRHYAFTQSPNGADVGATVVSQPLSLLGRLIGSMARKGSQQTMDAYVRAAQKELAGQRIP